MPSLRTIAEHLIRAGGGLLAEDGGGVSVDIVGGHNVFAGAPADSPSRGPFVIGRSDYVKRKTEMLVLAENL